jgi:hypothetical protein
LIENKGDPLLPQTGSGQAPGEFKSEHKAFLLGGVELDEFQQWCEYSMDPKFDEASVDAFERKLAQREKEQKNTYLLRRILVYNG